MMSLMKAERGNIQGWNAAKAIDGVKPIISIIILAKGVVSY